MPKIITSIGIAVVDAVFQVESLPQAFEKYRATVFRLVGGGLAGNAAATCAKLGANTRLITRLGDDKIATLIIDELEEYGVDCNLSRKFQGYQSPVSTIFVDPHGERMIMSYSDFSLPDDASWLPHNLGATSNAVTGDTRWETGALALFSQAKAAGISSIFDADRGVKTPQILHAASHIGFSAKALREMTNIDDLEIALKTLAKNHTNWLAVTDGARGVWFTHNGKIKHIPAFKVEVKDTLGAGDTWHGALAVALSENMPIEKAVTFANAASALKCQTFGGRAGIPNRQELNAFLTQF